MASWESFETTFSSKRDISYDSKLIEKILANRRALDNTLFIDRLLKILGVNSASKVYPPRSNQALRALYKQIVSSSSPNHHKQSLIYYILRDFRGNGDGTGPLQFARKCYLPERFRLFIDGLWYLDRLEFRRALEYLTEPSLIPTFPDEILYALTSSPKQDDGLAIAYYVTTSPPLASTKTLIAYFDTLCRTSVTEAFYFSRKREHSVRDDLLVQLIKFVLSIKAGETRAKKAMDLINLPMNDVEEQWFEDYLLNGEGKHLHGAQDTVMMRRVATNRLENLDSGLGSLGGRRIEGLNWDDLKKNLRPDTLFPDASATS